MTQQIEAFRGAIRRRRDPMEEGPYDVFIAYAREDSKPFVIRLVRALEERGMNVYVDFDDIKTGAQDWKDEIRRGIELSHNFAFVVSPLSVASSECSDELDLATGFGKRLLTIIRSTPEEADLSELDPRLRVPQFVTFPDERPFNECVDGFVRALTQDLDWLREHTELLMRANRWERDGCERSQLLRGGELGRAESWLGKQGGTDRHPTATQSRYIRASRRQATFFVRCAFGALLLVLACLIGLSLWALAAKRTATSERKVAESRALAASALLNLFTSPESNGTNPTLSVLLSEKAVDIDQNREAESALRQSLAALSGLGRSIHTLAGHSKPLRDATFSSDGTLVATAALDGTARLWNAVSGAQIGCFRAPVGLTSVALSRDGRELAAGGLNGQTWIWRASARGSCSTSPTPAVRTLTAPPRRGFASSGTQSVEFDGGGRLLTGQRSGVAYVWKPGTNKPAKAFRVRNGSVETASFGPGGRQVLTAGHDGVARVWDVASGRQVASFGSPGAALEMAAFSPDGRQVATAGDDGVARLWRMGRAQPVGQLQVGNDTLYTVTFAPNGDSILLGGFDSSARVWDPLTGQVTSEFLGHRNTVVRARFDPKGTRVVTASWDGSARIWALPNQGSTLPAASSVRAAEFSPDGRSIITSERNGQAQIWSVSPLRVTETLTAGGPLTAAHFSSDGKRVVTAGQDGSARVFITGTRRSTELPGSRPLRSAAISPDDRRVVTASASGVAVWSIAGRPHVTIRLSRKPTSQVAFSPDGKLVVAAGADRVARVWKLSDPNHPIMLRGRNNLPVVSASFDPTGKYVVTASQDGTAKIFSVANRRVVTAIRGHTASANSASFSQPDGRLVITGGDDQVARLWDVTNGALLSLFPDPAAVIDAEVQPAGGKILVTGSDGKARLYECVQCAPIAVLRRSAAQRVPRSLTPAERKKYL